MEVLYPRCAGLDVHKKEVVACLRLAMHGKAQKELRSFGTTTGELMRLSDWLHEAGVTHVAMESTGPYWRPVWHVLEGTFELVLANAREVKNVPGRKSDAKDAEWLSDLLAHGLIKSSFVPEEPIQELRDLTRTRKQMTRERGRHVQRIQKILEYANVKLSSVVTDILGLSGRTILTALIEGERDPDKLAALGHVRLKASKDELREALAGHVTEHHRFMLKLHLEQIGSIDRMIDDLESRAEARLEPFRSKVEHLDTIPGINQRVAATIIAEIGADMSRFRNDDALVAWSGLCRGLNESAGKIKSARLRKGGNWLKDTMVQAAWAAVKKKDSYFHAKFARLRRRRGERKAIVAIAASMLRAAYYMIRDDKDFHDLGADHYNRFDRNKKARQLIRQLTELGMEVEVRECAA